ncbi:hypothetical protein VNI00_006920 [Paramarasmius palmivorus]|uniref:Uncharacterized protein n=1 Tax=Paramarasmius palmivorus TaxID=297713 RepID=A0AAW0D4V2_9AGAR
MPSETTRYLEAVVNVAKTLPTPTIIDEHQAMNYLDAIHHYLRNRDTSRERVLVEQNHRKDLEITELRATLANHRHQVDDLKAVVQKCEEEIGRLKLVEEELGDIIQDLSTKVAVQHVDIQTRSEEQKLFRKELLDVCDKFDDTAGNTNSKAGKTGQITQAPLKRGQEDSELNDDRQVKARFLSLLHKSVPDYDAPAPKSGIGIVSSHCIAAA